MVRMDKDLKFDDENGLGDFFLGIWRFEKLVGFVRVYLYKWKTCRHRRMMM